MRPAPSIAAFTANLTRAQRAKLEPRVEEQLAACLAVARERWPKVKLPEAELFAHLAQKLEGAAHPNEGLERLRAADLYIALACAKGDPVAIEALEARVMPELVRSLAPYRLDAAALDDVLQRLRERVFIARGGAPRIATYAGAGPLAAWLAAAAVRLAVDATRAPGASKKHEDERLADKVQDPGDVELGIIKRRYRTEFREAFQLAFEALTPEERNLVRFNFIDGLNIEQIGTMQGVHRSTIARRIARIREDLLEGTRTTLKQKFKLSASEVNSLLRLVRSDFGMSLNEALNHPAGLVER